MVNLREGTRRLALLLGVAGAIAGGFVSYLELQTVLDQRARHNRFEQLANSDVVKDQRKFLQSPDPFASIAKPIPDSSDKISGLPPGATLKSIPQHGKAKLSDAQPIEYDASGQPLPAAPTSTQPVEWDANGKPIAAASSTAKPTPHIDPKTGERIGKLSDIAPPAKVYLDDNGNPIDWRHFTHIPTEVDKGGIQTINWGEDYEIASIDTTDGEILSPTSAPSAWQYLFVVFCPIFGFIAPWGVIRAIGWVVAGFVKSSV